MTMNKAKFKYYRCLCIWVEFKSFIMMYSVTLLLVNWSSAAQQHCPAIYRKRDSALRGITTVRDTSVNNITWWLWKSQSLTLATPPSSALCRVWRCQSEGKGIVYAYTIKHITLRRQIEDWCWVVFSKNTECMNAQKLLIQCTRCLYYLKDS